LLVGGAVALCGFAVVQTKVRAPLLPPRIVAERNRSGAFVVLGLASLAMFGVFLFLTFYLQVVKGYTPLRTGFAFLPLSAMIIATSVGFSARMLPRLAPRRLLVPGLVIAAAGMAWLTQLKVGGSYAGEVLPAELLLGLGFGLTFMPVFSVGTFGVEPHDAGIASATLNTAQQVGGSIGTALLNTIATSATAAYATAHLASAKVLGPNLLRAQSAVHGYAVATGVAAAVLLLSALAGGLMINAGPVSGHGAESTKPGA
jgi:Major Facilitator Superfamily